MENERSLDIVCTIAREIETDYENGSKSLAHMYEHGTPAEQVIIDRVLVAICGWSYPTLKHLATEGGFWLEDD